MADQDQTGKDTDDGQLQPQLDIMDIFGTRASQEKYKHEPYKKLKKVSPQVKPFDVATEPPAIMISPPARSSRRSSSSSLGTICEVIETAHLQEVRTLTEKLHLKVRRPSIMEWKARQAEERLRCLQRNKTRITCRTCLSVPPSQKCICLRDSVPAEMKSQRIGHALCWLREELLQMKQQDEELAHTLIQLRRDLHKIKLERCSAEHRALLEDAIDAEQELREPSCRISDSIPEALSPTLRDFGLTRMNITARRFSVF